MADRDSLTDYYAARAAEYERIYQKPERQIDLAQLRTLLQDWSAGQRVLEVACGTGYWTDVICRNAERVLALDINEEVLAFARAKLTRRTNVTLRVADVYSLPAFEEHFTAGLAGFWWSHVRKSRLSAFLTQFHRALAPGARVMFLDNRYVEGSSTPISRVDAEGNSYQLRSLDDGSTHEVLKNFPTETELRSKMVELGIQAQVQTLKYYWVLTYTLPPGGGAIAPLPGLLCS